MKFYPIIQYPTRSPLELLLRLVRDRFLSPEERIRRFVQEHMDIEVHWSSQR